MLLKKAKDSLKITEVVLKGVREDYNIVNKGSAVLAMLLQNSVYIVLNVH